MKIDYEKSAPKKRSEAEEFLQSQVGKEFTEWWKEHSHAGFCEDSEGKWHWNTRPYLAWQCDCYRQEFYKSRAVRVR